MITSPRACAALAAALTVLALVLGWTGQAHAQATCRTGGALGGGNQTGYYTGYYDGLCGQFVWAGYGFNYGNYCASAGYSAGYLGIGTTATGACSNGSLYNYQAGGNHSQCRNWEYYNYGYDYGGGCSLANMYVSSGACTGCQPGSTSAALTVGVTSGVGSITAAAAGIYGCTSASCNGSVPAGTTVTITASMGSGTTFSGWTGDCAGQGATCTLAMTGNKTARASFYTCAPYTSCYAQGRTCGTIYNGCANESCGSCGGGQTCSSAGQCVASNAYLGYLDGATCASVFGWAWDAGQPNTPINVDLFDGAIHLATVSANQFRADVMNAGFGNGYHGFTWSPPGGFTTNRSITARVQGNGFTLIGSPRSVSCGCVATTSCAAQGRSCGSIFNGCTTEVCGSSGGGCPGGQSCSAAGQCQGNGDDITADLVGWWKLDEGGGGYAGDAVAGRGGSLGGGASFTTGKIGAGLALDGTGYVPIAIDVPEAQYSFSAWFRTSAESGTILAVVDPVGPYAGSYDRPVGLSGGRVCHRVWSEETYCSPGTYNDDRWHLVVVTVGAGGGRLYVDGAQVASGGKTASDFTWQGGIVLGMHAYSWGGFAGVIDDVRVYRKVLSAGGVSALLQTGGCLPSTSCALQGRSCGTIFDGCGIAVCGGNGGGCPSGETCNAGTCGCQPTTSCAAQGKSCGTVDTGCGVETCGSFGGGCPGGQSCSAGQCSCTPSCAGKQCGQDNGCGAPCCTGSGCTAVACPACQQPSACGSSCSAVGNTDPPALCTGGMCQNGACNVVGELLCDGSRAGLGAQPRIDQMLCGVGSAGNALAINFLGQWFTIAQGSGGGWAVANAVGGVSPLGVAPQVQNIVESADDDFSQQRDSQLERANRSTAPSTVHRIRTYSVAINGRSYVLRAEQVLYDQRFDLPSRSLVVDGDVIFTLTSADPADGASWTVVATPRRLVPGVDASGIEAQAENADQTSQIAASGALFNQRNTVFSPEVELSSAIKQGGPSTSQFVATSNPALNHALDDILANQGALDYQLYQSEAVNISGFLSSASGGADRFYDKTRRSQFYMNTRSSSGFSNPGTDRPLIETSGQSSYRWTLHQPIVDYDVYWPFLAGICGLSAGVHASIDGSFQAGADSCVAGLSSAAWVRGNLSFDLSASGGFGCNIVVASASAGLSAGVGETLEFASDVQTLPPKISAHVNLYASAAFSAFFRVRVLFWTSKWQKTFAKSILFQRRADYEVDIPGLPSARDLDHDCTEDCSQNDLLSCGCGDHDGDCFDDCSGIPGACDCSDPTFDFVNDCAQAPMTHNAFPWGQYISGFQSTAPGGPVQILAITIQPLGAARYIVQVQTTRGLFQTSVGYTPEAGNPEKPMVAGNWVAGVNGLGPEDGKFLRSFVATLGRWDGARADLEQAMQRTGISSTNQRAAFLAMVAGESAFTVVAEYAPRNVDAQQYFEDKYGPGSTRAAGLGNTQPGDGYRFRGRGPIQLTGRRMYQAASTGLFGDNRLVDDPDMVVNNRSIGMMTSAYYFAHIACSGGIDRGTCARELADQDRFEEIARMIASGRTTGVLPPTNVTARFAWYFFFRDGVYRE